MSDPSGTGMVVFFGTVVLGLISLLLVASGVVSFIAYYLAYLLGYPFDVRIVWALTFLLFCLWWKKMWRR